jgi:hypothetical protein
MTQVDHRQSLEYVPEIKDINARRLEFNRRHSKNNVTERRWDHHALTQKSRTRWKDIELRKDVSSLGDCQERAHLALSINIVRKITNSG